MIVLEWTRFLIGGGLLLCGLGTFIIEIIGVFRFRYVLNRMHAAAIGDTLGIGFALLGLIVISGLNFTSLKLFLVIAFLWFSSPVSSHLIARLEVSTNEESAKHYRVKRLNASEAEGALATRVACESCGEPVEDDGSESRAETPVSDEAESGAEMSVSDEARRGAMAGNDDPERTGTAATKGAGLSGKRTADGREAVPIAQEPQEQTVRNCSQE